MFFWFMACGVVVVAYVFGSGGVDYRVVSVGSVLPLAESATGAPWVMHTLSGSAVLLLLVMAATAGRGRRLRRRRWLGLPVGTLVFLVASGAWQRTALFWWPLAGAGGVGHGTPPEFDRPVALLVLLEVAGCAVLALVARHHGMGHPERRVELLKTGRMVRGVERAPRAVDAGRREVGL